MGLGRSGHKQERDHLILKPGPLGRADSGIPRRSRDPHHDLFSSRFACPDTAPFAVRVSGSRHVPQRALHTMRGRVRTVISRVVASARLYRLGRLSDNNSLARLVMNQPGLCPARRPIRAFSGAPMTVSQRPVPRGAVGDRSRQQGSIAGLRGGRAPYERA